MPVVHERRVLIRSAMRSAKPPSASVGFCTHRSKTPNSSPRTVWKPRERDSRDRRPLFLVNSTYDSAAYRDTRFFLFTGIEDSMGKGRSFVKKGDEEGQRAKTGGCRRDSNRAGAGSVLKGGQKKLVPFDPEGVRDGPLGLSPMPEPDASHCLH
jgi:hypothetical protein